MDRKELLKATLAGENTDRVCCGFWYHFDEEHKFGKKSFEAHMQFCESINPDILKVMNEHTFIIKEKISTPEDWKKITRLPFSETGYEDYLDEFKTLKKALPKDLPLFATIHGVLVSAYHATEGVGNFKNVENMVSRHLRQDPDAVDHGLKIIAQTLTELSEKLIDAGADGIFYAALGGEEYRFSEDLFLNHVKPFDKMVIDGIKAHGGMSILHICKDKIRLPLYSGIDADVINWDIHDCKHGIEDGRKYFPQKTILGGFDDRSGILVEGTKQEIEEETMRIIQKAGRQKLIIGADCTLPGDIAPWRIRTAIEAAHRS